MWLAKFMMMLGNVLDPTHNQDNLSKKDDGLVISSGYIHRIGSFSFSLRIVDLSAFCSPRSASSILVSRIRIGCPKIFIFPTVLNQGSFGNQLWAPQHEIFGARFFVVRSTVFMKAFCLTRTLVCFHFIRSVVESWFPMDVFFLLKATKYMSPPGLFVCPGTDYPRKL